MIVTDQYIPMIGGVTVVTQGLATELANRGHQVSLAAPGITARNSHSIDHKVEIYYFSSFRWPIYEGMRIPYLPFLSFRKLLKNFEPDIIHIHSLVVLGNIAKIEAHRLDIPVIMTNHYLPVNLTRSLKVDTQIGKPFKAIFYSYLVQLCNRCEYVTAPTKTAINLLYEHGLKAPAQAISNGIDLKRFSPGQPDEQVRRRLKLPPDRPLILSVNRLSREKRIDVLIDAAAKLKQNAHVVIASIGPDEADLRNQVEQLHLNDKVTFLGFVDDAELTSLYRLADIFAIPSQAELQSLATMEAMACGLPVVAADAYALSELVHHNYCGFLFQRGNSDELAAYLDILVADRELRKQMGAHSLQMIARHDRSLIIHQWESLYYRISTEFIEAKERLIRQRSKFKEILS
jgi:glycosyltransferase involved in cell wall biosynthesis